MKILYITRSPPYPPNMGGNQRTAMLYQALSRHGEVDLFLAVDERDLPGAHLAELRKNYRIAGFAAPAPRGQLGLWHYLRPLAPPLIDRVAEYLANRRNDYLPDAPLASALARWMKGKPYDVVVGKGLSLAMKTGISPAFPFVLDVDDAEQEWYSSQMDNPHSGRLARWVAAWRFSQLKNFVPGLYRRFEHCWIVKTRDRLIPGLEHATWLGVPCWPPQEGFPSLTPGNSASRAVIMLGSYYHRPNAEGLDWFIRKVWPLVRKKVPDAEFRVIGPGLSVRRAEAYGRVPGVRVLGAVPGVAPQYCECAFSVAPIWTGAGINVKVFEAYAYSRTCVLTPFAYRGYEDCLEEGLSVRVAKTPEEFARACSDLLRDPALREGLAAAGHSQIIGNFSFERFARVVRETLDKIRRAASRKGWAVQA